jgi:hypothetical protein
MGLAGGVELDRALVEEEQLVLGEVAVRRRSSARADEAVEREHRAARFAARDVEDVPVAGAPVRLARCGAVNRRSSGSVHASVVKLLQPAPCALQKK